jgi:hypothetical protein
VIDVKQHKQMLATYDLKEVKVAEKIDWKTPPYVGTIVQCFTGVARVDWEHITDDTKQTIATLQSIILGHELVHAKINEFFGVPENYIGVYVGLYPGHIWVDARTLPIKTRHKIWYMTLGTVANFFFDVFDVVREYRRPNIRHCVKSSLISDIWMYVKTYWAYLHGFKIDSWLDARLRIIRWVKKNDAILHGLAEDEDNTIEMEEQKSC